MRRYARLWIALYKNSLAREMEFKFNFLTGMVIEFVWQFFNIFFFGIIYLHVGNIADWSFNDVLVFMGTLHIIDGLGIALIMRNVTELPQNINTGALDFYLLKPVNTQFLVSCRYTHTQGALSAASGVAMVWFGLARADWSFDLVAMLLYIAMTLNGALLLYSTMMLFQTMSFWLLASQGFQYGYFMFYNFITKPDSIYRGATRVVLTYVLPAVVIASWPARGLLGKALDWHMVLWAFAAGLGSLWLSTRFFKRGLRRYESASS